MKVFSALLMVCYLMITYEVCGHDAIHKQQQGGDESFNMTSKFSRKQYGNQKEDTKYLSCSEDSSCPSWFYCSNQSSKCTCGQSHEYIMRCNQTLHTADVLDCYCVTLDEKRNTTVAGACFFNCHSSDKRRHGYDTVYHPLPQNVTKLNKVICEQHYLNRTGPLCGECKPDASPLAYSYNLSCVHCPDGHKNWWKYIVVAFLPLTIFYFVVMFFKINATSSHLHGYVLFAQGISLPAFVRILMLAVIKHKNSDVLKLIKVGISLYGFWNLDFFRALIPNICLRTTTLQTLALDYVIAVYPLFLMIVSYVLIELHDRNFRVAVFIWKPFRSILLFFRKSWDSRTSVIDAYATFFLLSYSKFLSVSFDILTPTSLYTLNSNHTTLVLYYDGSIEYFGKEHLPYAVLAIVVLFVFVSAPTMLLIFYPFIFFQKFLNCFPVGWSNILRTFVDSFLGCYKDGTEPGTRDCRWFAAVFLLCRIFALLIYSLTLGSTFFGCVIILFSLLAMLMVIVQPFKPAVAHYTKINATFTLLIALFFAAVINLDISGIKGHKFAKPSYITSFVFGGIPLAYTPCIAIHWLFAHCQRKWSRNLISKFKAWRQGYDWNGFESDQDMDESLPDRIVNPNQYHERNLTDFHNISYESREHTLSKTY